MGQIPFFHYTTFYWWESKNDIQHPFLLANPRLNVTSHIWARLPDRLKIRGEKRRVKNTFPPNIAGGMTRIFPLFPLDVTVTRQNYPLPMCATVLRFSYFWFIVFNLCTNAWIFSAIRFRLTKITAKLKLDFIDDIYYFWLWKRKSRFGVPLVRRFQVFCIY